ncbi:hypothetical protein [Leptolyngbya sp. Cla-17]|nr:hypothetical protein [Leptolyngbya sp. Cla-17]
MWQSSGPTASLPERSPHTSFGGLPRTEKIASVNSMKTHLLTH